MKGDEGVRKDSGKGRRIERNTRISVDLAEVLKPQELELFMEKARAAGRSAEEHFLAITIGSKAELVA